MLYSWYCLLSETSTLMSGPINGSVTNDISPQSCLFDKKEKGGKKNIHFHCLLV